MQKLALSVLARNYLLGSKVVKRLTVNGKQNVEIWLIFSPSNAQIQMYVHYKKTSVKSLQFFSFTNICLLHFLCKAVHFACLPAWFAMTW